MTKATEICKMNKIEMTLDMKHSVYRANMFKEALLKEANTKGEGSL
jgi:hypothetical protein